MESRRLTSSVSDLAEMIESSIKRLSLLQSRKNKEEVDEDDSEA
jgi:hypothetical protein